MAESIHDFFKGGQVQISALSQWLDGLAPDARKHQVRSLRAKEQSALFEAAQGFRAITLDDIVPAGTPPMQQVIHYGRNTLPLFANFEKRFVRPPDNPNVLWGYNREEMAIFIGPGYFVADDPGMGEVHVDYSKLPAAKPEGWPRIRSNACGLSYLVYYGMEDIVRGVSKYVTISRTKRHGKLANSWFVLCRQA